MWCPRCHGVLLSPVSEQSPARGRRNFRWVARTPASRTRPRRHDLPTRRVQTPRYEQIPRWGLTDRPVNSADEPETRLKRWADAAPGLLMLTAALLGLAVVAEGVRYAILLYNRTRLVSPTTLVVSDALVLFAEVASIVIGIAAAAASACWLVTRRREAFEQATLRDPRSERSLVVGCLVPVLSLVMPGVYLTELANTKNDPDRDPLLLRVRIWWALWVINWLLVVIASIWRTRDSLQAQADGVFLAAVLALVGAGVALMTIHIMRSVDGLRWRGGRKAEPTRWVVAVARERTPDAEFHDSAGVDDAGVDDRDREDEAAVESGSEPEKVRTP